MNGMNRVVFFIPALLLMVSGCGGGGGEKCTAESCSGHGVCDDTSGTAVCTCDAGWSGDDCSQCAVGYQDNDSDGTCLPDCGHAGLNCGEHGSCSDSSGEAVCVCDEGYRGVDCSLCDAGYQDYDGDGTCLPRCENAGLDCHHGTCADASGTPLCVCEAGYAGDDCSQCASGYQDNDSDGTCLPDCSSAGLDCGTNGSCDDSSGQAVCTCNEGYAGENCSECAQDYQDNDRDGVCLPACSQGLSCSGHGVCDDSSGQMVCVCEPGYTGDDCGMCAPGYQDNDNDGTCMLDCYNARPDCTIHGHCDDSGGEAVCVCDTGYTGNLCENCAPGYQDNDGNGTCRPDCATANLGCVNGSCDDSSGVARCVCDAGYTGDVCDQCAPGYQDNDGDGVCSIGCPLANLDCGTHGTCDDSTGTPLCTCYEGYTGADCRECAAGYQDNDGNGTCHPTCQTAGLQCQHGGSCSDASGHAVCECVDNWGGELCDVCAPGYQDNDGNDTCEPNCATAGLGCGLHQHCDDSTGTAECVCDEGYVGENCDTCDTGYQDYDSNGTCRPTCETIGYDVSCAEGGHGYCDDSSGEPLCVCDAGYFPDGMGHCTNATGFDCAAPLPLPVANASYQDSTTGAGNDYSPGCVSYSSAEEMVYVINVSVPVHMKFTTEGFDTVLYLRDTCSANASDLACDDDGGPGRGSMIEYDFQPGTYFLFVDGYSNYGGNYTLTVEISCPQGQVWDPSADACVDDPCLPDNPCTAPNQTVCEPTPSIPPGYVCHCDPGYIDDPQNPGTCIVDPNPHGEACADVMPLEVLDSGTVTGTTSDAQDDAQGSCAGNGPDRVYGFTLSAEMRAEFYMGGFDTVLHLRTTCDDPASEVACDDDGGSGTESQLGPVILQPGTYYLWADGYSSGGDYTLTYSFRVNPCADEEAVCPGTPVCQASDDWSSYECVCPAGYLPFQGDCVDDPCDPNPCTEPHKNRCVPDLPGAYTCECNIGYIDDPQNPGTCIMDPNANEWTFMVYINADNNLNDAGLDDVSEMEVAGSNPYVHIVVLIDTAYGNFCGGASGSACKIYINQGSHEVIENMGEIDMGDWQTLRDFGIWAIQNYPARHYALVTWDHGSGWDKAKIRPPYKGMSWDDSSGNHISIAGGEYEQALAGITAALGDKLDIVGHDECLMGMWEVAVATAPYARYFVASEETEPFDGWAYDGFLPQLVNDPLNTTALLLGQHIADAYHDADPGNSTMAVIDLETMDQLNSTMAAFASALSAHSDLNSQIDSVRSSTQSFYYSEHRDLKDFAMRIVQMSGVPQDLADAAQALVDQLDITIAYNRAQNDYPGAYGMAVYLPSRSSSPDSSYMQGIWCQLVPEWCQWLQGFNR